MKRRQNRHHRRQGMAILVALAFIAVFTALSVGMLSMSSANIQLSNNHHNANMALNAALSGLEYAKWIAAETMDDYPMLTPTNYVTDDQANMIWANLCTKLGGSGEQTEIQTQFIPYNAGGSGFRIRFYRDSNPKVICVQCTGQDRAQDGALVRNVGVNFDITKDARVLNYALAGRGRMWITGDTTIHGDIYSSWSRADISPFNMTGDSRVEGTINTVIDLADIQAEGYQMETLDAGDNPLFNFGADAYDSQGNPITDTYGPADSGGYLQYLDENDQLQYAYDENGYLIPADFENRFYSANDEVQGYHENINYSQLDQNNIPGLDIGDYNTDMYYTLTSSNAIPSAPTSSRVTEYFPHASGNYNQPRDSSSLALTRHVYENQTFTNAQLPNNRNALFRNCTFNEVLYIDCNKNTSSYYNNVRFENCAFNGVIVTDTPSALNWKKNCLYFTGAATFNNQSSIPEATILAPHFNVNLGNTNPQQSDNNVLRGAIVGGIVDVRGNAQIYGTIISMCDTSQWSSGYVTNIGATEDDGGSETTEAGDIGTIEITPDEGQMLPSGITTPVILKPAANSYAEII